MSFDADAHRAGLFAWVAFGKTGSTSLRYALWERARRHQWPVWPKPKCICAEDDLRGARRPRRALRCASMPDGYVIQTGEVGYCERLKTSRHHDRPCTYLTLLREPQARVRSAFNYYCRRCAEHFCIQDVADLKKRVANNARLKRSNEGILLHRPFNTCPNMTLLDYAKMEGNRYVRALATPNQNLAQRSLWD